jgi:hypothetical protein
MTTFPDHGPLLREAYGSAVHDLIARAHWQTAKSVEHVEGGQHQYNVKGWDKDDLTEDEFWLLVNVIKAHGRQEVWTAPAGFYDSGKRPSFKNTYLYPGDGFAYWFTWPRNAVPMLNREHVSVQEKAPTRRPFGPDQLSFDQ